MLNDEIIMFYLKAKNVTKVLIETKQELVSLSEQGSNEFERFEMKIHEILNLTSKINSFKDSFENVVNNIQSLVEFIENANSTKSKLDFDNILDMIDDLGKEFKKKADEIREETSGSKNEALELGKNVDNLEKEQRKVLDKVAEKETKLQNKQDLMNKADENLKEAERLNKQTSELINEVIAMIKN